MILTVTLNPSVDKLYQIETLRPRTVMRVKTVHNTAGGKGLNVSRVVSLLGEPVRALGFVGGHNGALLCSLLEGTGIDDRFTRVEAETRCCINIREQGERNSTELLEPGAQIQPSELGEFLETYDREVAGCDVVTLSGSLPKGVAEDFYATLTVHAKRAGKPVLLDTSGQPLICGLRAAPNFIKPNTEELEQLTGKSIKTMRQAIKAARWIHQSGISCAAVSMGKDGVLVSSDQGDFHGTTPDVPIVNTVGCGDSMVAGFAVGMVRGLEIEEQIRLAVAVSTANAMTQETGNFRKADLEALLGRIEVRKITE